jgi:hypothetical protein
MSCYGCIELQGDTEPNEPLNRARPVIQLGERSDFRGISWTTQKAH